MLVMLWRAFSVGIIGVVTGQCMGIGDDSAGLRIDFFSCKYEEHYSFFIWIPVVTICCTESLLILTAVFSTGNIDRYTRAELDFWSHIQGLSFFYYTAFWKTWLIVNGINLGSDLWTVWLTAVPGDWFSFKALSFMSRHHLFLLAW